MREGFFIDHWRVRRAGKLGFRRRRAARRGNRAKLGQPASAAGGIAIATVLWRRAMTQRHPPCVRSPNISGRGRLSSWSGIAVARLCAKDGAALGHDLIALLAALGAPVPRLWLN